MKRRMFPGLALPDQPWQLSNEFGKDKDGEKDVMSKEVDDLMSQLEGVAKKKAAKPAAADFIEPKPPSKRPRRDMEIDSPPRAGPSRGRDRDREDRGRDRMVHVSTMAPGGGRVNSVQDLLSRNQSVKVKVMSVGSRISLSMKDVGQQTGQDLTPHLRIKSEAGLAQEALTGSNSAPLGEWGMGGLTGITYDDSTPVRSAKRLTSPERWEIKQLIALGAVDASEYPNLDKDFNNPHAKAEVEEELDVKEVNEQADSEARDFSTPWLDPMSQNNNKMFGQDTRGNIMGQKAGEVPQWGAERFNKATTFGKITSLSITDQRQSLPIFKLRDKLVQAVRDHQISVVVGDTGSGKTTQMTQYLAQEGFAKRGEIGCTQPRQVAAMSVAKRVAEEVGYTIRFEDCTSPETKIKYTTDGMLQRGCLVDPNMGAYSVLILDEAHERTIATDVLFGLLKTSAKERPDLKIIVTSATLKCRKSKIFDPAPPGARKVVIAMNIVKTSITIDGIYYVIDPGFVKQNAYDPRLGMDSLIVTPISQAQANQRAGRAGGTGPGKCYRLYTEVAFRNEMLPSPIPDIQRQNPSHTILMLKFMGTNDHINFPFMCNSFCTTSVTLY
ncbi:ATP-dependent RNA helicase DHX8/PRP22 [Rhizoctonia solani]|uniref:RNA helicase n=1 Tax=Rhizoctonia solani TaxID=456999 RepID=A0A0K6G8K4_9AGAM|nr:ATP-dependent RNA helicase DHX8/PRP22 [Rhizoctonia solani]